MRGVIAQEEKLALKIIGIGDVVGTGNKDLFDLRFHRKGRQANVIAIHGWHDSGTGAFTASRPRLEATVINQVMLGDLNGDAKINVQDATLSLRISVGSLVPTEAQKAAGDVNKDGKWNVQDTTLILRRGIGAITKFPGEP